MEMRFRIVFYKKDETTVGNKASEIKDQNYAKCVIIRTDLGIYK